MEGLTRIAAPITVGHYWISNKLASLRYTQENEISSNKFYIVRKIV